MSASLIATTISAQASLTAQIARMQADILAAGNLDNATVDDISAVLTDAMTAAATAATLEAAHGAILFSGAAPSQLAGGQPAASLMANFALLQAASVAAPLAFDTMNRLQRIVDNIQAISPATGPIATLDIGSALPPGYAYLTNSEGQQILTSSGQPIFFMT